MDLGHIKPRTVGREWGRSGKGGSFDFRTRSYGQFGGSRDGLSLGCLLDSRLGGLLGLAIGSVLRVGSLPAIHLRYIGNCGCAVWSFGVARYLGHARHIALKKTEIEG